MQVSQGGFSILPNNFSLSGGMYPGLQQQPQQQFGFGSGSIWQQQAMGGGLTNAPQQESGVSQGLDLLSNANKVSDLFNAPSQSSSSILGNITGVKDSVNSALSPVTSFVDDIGSSLGFGAAKGSPLLGGVGPTNVAQTGSLGTTASLSGTLGAAGIGSFTGQYLGKLFGGSAQGGSIGGGIGAGIGYAVGGPIGGVVGNVAGSLLGSFFGGKKPNPASGFSATGGISADGSFKNTQVGSKHYDNSIGTNTQNELENYFKSQAKKYGLEYSGISGIWGGSDKGWYGSSGHVGISSMPDFWEKGLVSGMGPKESTDTTKVFKFDINDETARKKAYEDAWRYAVQVSGKNPDELKPVAASSGQPVLVRNQQQESPFDAFLKQYREKQNANLA